MDKTKSNKLNNRHLRHWQRIAAYLIAYDIVAVSLSYFLSLLMRFDFAFSRIPYGYLHNWELFAPVYAVICITVFWRLRLYKSIWRFASFKELERVFYATAITAILHIVLITLIFGRMPISYYVGGALIQFLLVTGIRFMYRFILLLREVRSKGEVDRIMIVGAGSAGQTLLRDVRRTRAVHEKVVCIIDDNNNKWGREIDGVPVVGANCILGTTL